MKMKRLACQLWEASHRVADRLKTVMKMKNGELYRENSAELADDDDVQLVQPRQREAT